MAETLIIIALVIVNFILLVVYLLQRQSLNQAQKFLDEFMVNSEGLVNAVDKCISIINKNAELLLTTAQKTDAIEVDVGILKGVYAITKDYFSAIETINEARQQELVLSKRVYQLAHKEEE